MIEYRTIHDLAADGDWEDIPGVVGFRVRGGRVVWESATYPERGGNYRVRAQRFVVTDGPKLRVLTSFLHPDTPITLVYKETK